MFCRQTGELLQEGRGKNQQTVLEMPEKSECGAEICLITQPFFPKGNRTIVKEGRK